MTHAWESGEKAPSPEELMAFADHELSAERHNEVSDWLAGHPEAAGEVDEHRRLHRLWQTNALPEPAPQAWAEALSRVDALVPHPLPPQIRPWSRPLWMAAAVAALVPLFFLGRIWLAPPGPVENALSVADTRDSDEPFPVAAAHEIDIVSMDAEEADSLVGHPSPLRNLQFATPADIDQVQGAQGKGDAVFMLVASPAEGLER
jgi:anti-sigma factor RsiW